MNPNFDPADEIRRHMQQLEEQFRQMQNSISSGHFPPSIDTSLLNNLRRSNPEYDSWTHNRGPRRSTAPEDDELNIATHLSRQEHKSQEEKLLDETIARSLKDAPKEATPVIDEHEDAEQQEQRLILESIREEQERRKKEEEEKKKSVPIHIKPRKEPIIEELPAEEDEDAQLAKALQLSMEDELNQQPNKSDPEISIGTSSFNTGKAPQFTPPSAAHEDMMEISDDDDDEPTPYIYQPLSSTTTSTTISSPTIQQQPQPTVPQWLRELNEQRKAALEQKRKEDNLERLQRHTLRDQQEQEYQESLRRDREREEEKKRLEEKEAEEEAKRISEEEEKRQIEEALRYSEELMKMKKVLEIKQRLSEQEPAAVPGKTTEIGIRLPNGQRLTRRFLISDKLELLKCFVDLKTSEMDDPAVKDLINTPYVLVNSYPRQVYDDLNQTLEQAKLFPRAMVNIETVS